MFITANGQIFMGVILYVTDLGLCLRTRIWPDQCRENYCRIFMNFVRITHGYFNTGITRAETLKGNFKGQNLFKVT